MMGRLTCLRRSMTGPDLCFRIIFQGLEVLTRKAETATSRLYYVFLVQARNGSPELGQWRWKWRWRYTGDVEKQMEARDF